MPIHILSLRRTGSDPSRLDEYLQTALPPELARLGLDSELSKSKIRRLVMAGAVSIGARHMRNPAWDLAKGERISIRLDTERISFEKKPDDIPFELTSERVLLEDEWIIVVDKPAGFPTKATMVASRDHLQAAVVRYLALKNPSGESGGSAPYVGLHHRLDRETSGVILFTKDRRANPGAHKMFLEHLAQKEYEALTVRPARLPSPEFSVDDEIARISPKSAQGKWGAVREGGDHAHTDFRVLEVHPSFLRVKALPRTGRTHQIRVHLASLGMPLLGDLMYGGPESLPGGGLAGGSAHSSDSRKKTGQAANAYLKKKGGAAAGELAIPRVMLHAASLTFPHPIDCRLVTVVAPIPADFRAIIDSADAHIRPGSIQSIP